MTFICYVGQTTKDASSAIHGVINTIVNDEHQIIDLTSPTIPVIISTGTEPITPIMVSTGTMPTTPTMASRGIMPITPTNTDNPN